jgi:hypothetical protein
MKKVTGFEVVVWKEKIELMGTNCYGRQHVERKGNQHKMKSIIKIIRNFL